jgi:hypothetical protein
MQNQTEPWEKPAATLLLKQSLRSTTCSIRIKKYTRRIEIKHVCAPKGDNVIEPAPLSETKNATKAKE